MAREAVWSEVHPVGSAPCPSNPGVYRMLLADDEGLSGTSLARLSDGSVLYVGKAERSLAGRDLGQHLASGKTGSSTLRRSLGAVLKEKLSLTALPRNDGSTSKYRFDDEGEKRLTQWMHRHLAISWLVCCCAAEAADVEPEVIGALRPALNIDHNPEGEYRDAVRGMRAACRKEATQGPQCSPGAVRAASRPGGRNMGSADAVNRFLQQYMNQNGTDELDAVTAGALLDRERLLADSASRPGLPLRRLLREGLIPGSYQDASRRWHIPRLPT